MSKRGLASPQQEADSILSMTRKTFGKSNKQPPTLEEKLQRLTERELQTVLQTAQFVKLANGMGKAEPYQVTADYMYPKMPTGIRSLVAQVLEDAAPRNLPDNRAEERDKIQQATLDSYMPSKVVKDTEQEKVDRLQTAIVDKLKVS